MGGGREQHALVGSCEQSPSLYLMWAEPYSRQTRHKGVIACAGATSLGSNSHCLASAVQPGRCAPTRGAMPIANMQVGLVLHSPELDVPDGPPDTVPDGSTGGFGGAARSAAARMRARMSGCAPSSVCPSRTASLSSPDSFKMPPTKRENANN